MATPQDDIRSAEGFAIGMFQAVSAAATFGVMTSMDKLSEAFGRPLINFALTFFILALITSLCGAFFRHEYTLHFLKAVIVYKTDEEKDKHRKYGNFSLEVTRYMMLASLVFLTIPLVTTVLTMLMKGS